MTCLVDTSILLRLSNMRDPQYPVADRSVTALHRQGETLHITAQVLVEFRNSATRPVAVNGLGISVSEVERLSDGFEITFPLLPETPDIFPAWKALVQSAGVTGKQVHDARLAAVCHVHQVSHVLTFNVRHFTQFASYGPGLTIVDPNSV